MFEFKLVTNEDFSSNSDMQAFFSVYWGVKFSQDRQYKYKRVVFKEDWIVKVLSVKYYVRWFEINIDVGEIKYLDEG